MNIQKKCQQALFPEHHDFFQCCHASTLTCIEDGTVLVSFFAGTKEGADDTAIWSARRYPDHSWLKPFPLIQERGLAHWNPVLHYQDKTLWLFYKVGSSPRTWITRRIISNDGGLSWSPPKDLIPRDRCPRGPVKNKLLVLADGRWLAPASLETDKHWDAFADISEDKGQTWRKHDIPLLRSQNPTKLAPTTWRGLRDNTLWESAIEQVLDWDGVIQPTAWESEPGQIHMLMRSTRGYLYRSDSADGGLTWCPAYATPLPNNNSGIDVAHLGHGKLVLACNPVAGNWSPRQPLSLMFSDDNGVQWKKRIDLETGTNEDEFSYPAIINIGNTLHLTYTFNRKNILYQEMILY